MNTNEVNQNEQGLENGQELNSDFLKAAVKVSDELGQMVNDNKELGFILIGIDRKELEDKSEVRATCSIIGSGKVLVEGLRSVMERKDVAFSGLVSQTAKENMLKMLFGN
mgnify:CR=1 FL=1